MFRSRRGEEQRLVDRDRPLFVRERALFVQADQRVRSGPCDRLYALRMGERAIRVIAAVAFFNFLIVGLFIFGSLAGIFGGTWKILFITWTPFWGLIAFGAYIMDDSPHDEIPPSKYRTSHFD